jgi:hypothetical protein
MREEERRWLELRTSWHEGGGAVRLEGEANLSYQSQACLFTTSECLLTMVALINVKKNSNIFSNTSK